MSLELSDKRLVIEIKSGNRDAFGILYDKYVDAIYRFVLFKVGNQQEAQDITSESFIKAWKYIVEQQNIKNPRALIYKIARNLVIDYYRTNKSRISVDIESVALHLASNESDTPQGAYLKTEIQETVMKALAEIKDEYREVIILKFVEGVSIGEIAKILNRSHGAIRVLIHRATKALKSVLAVNKDP